ncbi:hypothetical protein ACC713_37790, partial [Rhizobium johnstonii]
SSAGLAPIPGSITYSGQPRTKLTHGFAGISLCRSGSIEDLLLESADLLSQHAELFAQVMIRLPGNADESRHRYEYGLRR